MNAFGYFTDLKTRTAVTFLDSQNTALLSTYSYNRCNTYTSGVDFTKQFRSKFTDKTSCGDLIHMAFKNPKAKIIVCNTRNKFTYIYPL
jgi:hypothetical protein